MQTTLISTDPLIATEITNLVWELKLIKGEIRISAYPPSFNKTEAKIIDPITGASTWALGNHKWKKNKGTLTKKAITLIKNSTQMISENLALW